MSDDGAAPDPATDATSSAAFPPGSGPCHAETGSPAMPAPSHTASSPTPARVLDLRGVGCPLNYVKTRVALDDLDPQTYLEVWLDPGEPEENVPRSCEEDGFPVALVEPTGEGYVRVVVQRP